MRPSAPEPWLPTYARGAEEEFVEYQRAGLRESMNESGVVEQSCQRSLVNRNVPKGSASGLYGHAGQIPRATIEDKVGENISAEVRA
jgi:hypothetical protein